MHTKNKIKAALAALALAVTGIFAGTVPAQAFSSSSSLTANGVTYKVSAYSCNLYWRSCNWSTTASLSKSMRYTHTSRVKANGFGVKVTISKSPGATLSGNSTNLVTSTQRGYGRYSQNKGLATPSLFSVSVAARSSLTAGGRTVSTGWTTW
ncbi:Uncharacterised protein [Trueperella bialowiezensis]|uniref:Uncharacterized protein n=1 Tax=Trueperella bialowiezensis TaxID=312285 RepID=A0A3S4YXK8_9ACTO|nr:Uncharacterised protein [Trueperella bialowiezensis]